MKTSLLVVSIMLFAWTSAFADSRFKEGIYESGFLGSESLIIAKLTEAAATSPDFVSYYNKVYVAPFEGTKVFGMKFTTKNSNIPAAGGGFKPWQIFREYCKGKNAKVYVWENGRNYIITASVKGKIEAALLYEVKYEKLKSTAIDPYKVNTQYLNPQGFDEYIANLGEAGKLYDEQKKSIDISNK